MYIFKKVPKKTFYQNNLIRCQQWKNPKLSYLHRYTHTHTMRHNHFTLNGKHLSGTCSLFLLYMYYMGKNIKTDLMTVFVLNSSSLFDMIRRMRIMCILRTHKKTTFSCVHLRIRIFIYCNVLMQKICLNKKVQS